VQGKKDDPDPLGQKLLRCKKPLDEALKFQKQLELFRADEVATCLSGIELYTRQQKWLLVCYRK